MSKLSTNPAMFEMGSGETLPLAFDTTALLGSGESPTSPSCTLTDLATGTVYATGLSGTPSVTGNIITQTVTALIAGHEYRLAVAFTAASGKEWQMELRIRCVI